MNHNLCEEINNELKKQGISDQNNFISNIIINHILQWKVNIPPTSLNPKAIVAFAFGNRIDEYGNRTPGPINELLAERTIYYYKKFGCPIWAQWEIGIIVKENKLLDKSKLNIIKPKYDIINDKPIYLSTKGILEEVSKDLEKGSELFIIAHHDHLWRCVQSALNVDFKGISENDNMPNEYDSKSGQIWTRKRKYYLLNDIISRLQLLRDELTK